MSDLVVLAFDSENGAIQLRDKLAMLQKQQIIQLEDAAVVIRRQDGKVKVKQAVSLVGAGALGGAFWGMLIGLIFWMPWLGMAMGALGGALGGKFTDIGVDDKFIKEVGNTIEARRILQANLQGEWHDSARANLAYLDLLDEETASLRALRDVGHAGRGRGAWPG